MSQKCDKRPEPVVVAMTWDDLWLVAIYLTNLEIAGSPRKVYRDRAHITFYGVEHRMVARAQAIVINRTPNT